MKIQSLKAKNFLSIGDEPLEIDFTHYGNIVVVKGQNLDVGNKDDVADDEHYSNGSGKSTVAECIVYALYGKCIRNKVSHGEVINAINRKKLEVEINFSKNNSDFRVLRTRKPDSLRIWQDEMEITLGGGPATQRQIENIMGLNHKAFVNMVCFGQHNSYNFLDCELAEQRSIIESILSLEIYKTYSDLAKEELKTLKQSLKETVMDYEKIMDSGSACKSRIQKIEDKQQEWRNSCESNIKAIHTEVESLQHKLNATSLGSDILLYEQAQQDISKVKQLVPDLIVRKDQIASTLSPAKEKYDSLRVKKHELSLDLKSLQKQAHDIEVSNKQLAEQIEHMRHLKEGIKCDKCFGKIDPQNYKHVITLKENNIDSAKEKLVELSRMIEIKNKEVQAADSGVEKLKLLIETANKKVDTIDSEMTRLQARMSELSRVKMPDSDAEQMVLTEKLANLREKLQTKLSELEAGGPYLEILSGARQELVGIQEKGAAYKAKIDEIEKTVPYYEFWVKGFSDEGIRSFIIQGIIPALNSRVGYWLQFLINGKLKVKFDKELNATIERNPSNGDPFAYNATCGGEKRRIDLAISQAFAHILMLSSGTKPSLVFLDEVATNIDKRGLSGVFKMICELAVEKQVFVITHDQTLLDMLDGADVITMKKENGISTKL